MKFVKPSMLIIALLFAIQVVFAQDTEPCRLILQNGLYKTFQFKRTANFEQDLKTYFSSDVFKRDYSNREWGGDINVVVPIGGVPTPIGLKANSDSNQVNEFSQKVATAESLKIDKSFYDFSLTSIPDVALAEAYTNCLNTRFGFTNAVDIGENEVTFSIIYKKEFDPDPMPTVKNFAVVNGQVLSGAVQIGDKIRNNQNVIVKRVPDKDLIFLFETDKGTISRRIPGESAGFNKDLPIGTIIASYLDFEQFSAVTSNNINSPGNLWTAQFSKWSPADGRPILQSKLQLISNSSNVPDLRGVFLRGLNQFDSRETSTVPLNQKDPDNRVRGIFQGDMFARHNHGGGNHNHTTGIVNGAKPEWNGYIVREENPNSVQKPTSNSGEIIQMQGGDETRPKNVAIFYYIRIN